MICLSVDGVDCLKDELLRIERRGKLVDGTGTGRSDVLLDVRQALTAKATLSPLDACRRPYTHRAQELTGADAARDTFWLHTPSTWRRPPS